MKLSQIICESGTSSGWLTCWSSDHSSDRLRSMPMVHTVVVVEHRHAGQNIPVLIKQTRSVASCVLLHLAEDLALTHPPIP